MAIRLVATLPQWSPIIFVPPSKDTSRKTVEQKRLTNRSHEEAFRLHTAPWRGASPPDLPFRSLRPPGEGPGCDSAFEPATPKKGLSHSPYHEVWPPIASEECREKG